MNPFLALILTFIAALGWLRMMDFFAHQGWIESRLSRKIIHIGTGPIFVLCWLLFDNVWYARWLAVLVPLAITVQFALIGFGIIKDEASVKAMSRSGDPKEILKGPLYYGIMFVIVTLVFWKDSPVGMIALMMMCGGDGIADIVGRRFRSARLIHSPQKSVAGSLGVLLGGWILSVLILGIYVVLGVFKGPMVNYLMPITFIAIGATIVESLPQKDIDNLTVTTIASVLGYFLIK